MQIEMDYTNKSQKFQAHILRGSWNIHIQKCVIFDGKNCYFYIPNILEPNDVVW